MLVSPTVLSTTVFWAQLRINYYSTPSGGQVRTEQVRMTCADGPAHPRSTSQKISLALRILQALFTAIAISLKWTWRIEAIELEELSISSR